jgi:PAS domain S-box-containing protein
MYSDFKPEKLEEYLPYFIDGIEDILLSWCTREATASLMQKRKLSEDNMVNVIGIRILSYTFDIIEQTESLKFCPYAAQLVEYFDNHGIQINELFLLYMDLSSVVREYLFKFIESSQSDTQLVLEDFSTIFEYNLSDVLNIYFTLQLSKITQEKKNVLKERKLLEDYKKIVDTINGIVVTDKDGFITFVNEKFCQYSGYRKEALIHRTFSRIRHPENPKELYEKMWGDIKNKELFRGIVKNRHKDGSDYYVDSTIAPIFDADDNVSNYIALQRDITKEIKQEKELETLRNQEENSRLSTIQNLKIDEFLDLIPVASFIISEEGTIIKYNELLLSHFDPFDANKFHEQLLNSTLNFEKLLTKISQKAFEKYPKIWLDIYNDVYSQSPLIIKFNDLGSINNFELKIKKIEDTPIKALVCLESIKN